MTQHTGTMTREEATRAYDDEASTFLIVAQWQDRFGAARDVLMGTGMTEAEAMAGYVASADNVGHDAMKAATVTLYRVTE